MTLQMHAAIAASEVLGGVEPLAVPHHVVGNSPAITSDLIPRLCAMRRMIGAKGFAVLASSVASSRIAGHLAPVLVDLGERNDVSDRVLFKGPLGEELGSHIEHSALPLTWPGPSGERPFVDADCRRLLVEAAFSNMPVAGAAFPVRLGTLGNGVILFTGEGMTVRTEAMFELHRLAYRVMTDLLKIEIDRTAPRQNLNDRELACLQWAGDGYKSEAIADKLGLSVHTVNAYLGSATAKLDAVNRIQAIAKAIRLGFIL